MAEYAHLSEPDPELVPLFDTIPKFEITADNLHLVRKGMIERGLPMINGKYEPHLPASSEYKVTDHQIDVGGGVKVRARSIVPTPRDGEDGTFPLLFWVHGGGFILGSFELEDYKLRIASVKQRVSIVSCEYRLAPEHPFPTPVDDATAGLKYVASHPDQFSASLKKGFLVGGASSGGNLAAVLAWIARDDPFFKGKQLTGQVLQMPFTVHHKGVPDKFKSSLLSYEQNKDLVAQNSKWLDLSMELYKPNPTDPRVSPLLLSSHKDLSPAFLQICGMDPFRDEGFLYEKVLKDSGVKTKFEVYPGTTHGFDGMFFETKQAVKFRDDFHKGLEWLLQAGKA